MNQEQIETEVNKLIKRQLLTRWVSLLIYFSIVIFGFYLIEFRHIEFEDGILYELAQSKLYLILTSYGGAMIGVTLGTWNGSDELKLLKSISLSLSKK